MDISCNDDFYRFMVLVIGVPGVLAWVAGIPAFAYLMMRRRRGQLKS